MSCVTLTVQINEDDLLAVLAKANVAKEEKAPQEPPKKYEGRFVFLERTTAEGKPDYYNGEYVIIRESKTTLYGIKPEVGYGGHDTRAFPLVGKSGFSIVEVNEDWKAASDLADDLIEWGTNIPNPKQWIENVYTSAKANGEALKRAIARSGPRKGC